MNLKKTAALWCVLSLLGPSSTFALRPVENSSEELFWTDPMTAHDYKKSTDLHSLSVSAMALTELEFVRLGDGLLNFSLRSRKNPIAASLDSLEYAYSELPRVEPVRRLGQLFDALQLRQISLSDARLLGTVLTGGGIGGVTPLMQVRIYKVMVWLEDVIYDLDKTLMYPLNRGVSSLGDKPSDLRSLGYAADGLGIVRLEFFDALKWISKEMVRASSKVIRNLEKPYDGWIRHERKKKNARILIYSKMPVSVFKQYLPLFTGKGNQTFAGTVEEWQARLLHNPDLLPDHVQQVDLPSLAPHLDKNTVQEVIVMTEYRTWEKTPRELKKYVIMPDEVIELVRP